MNVSERNRAKIAPDLALQIFLESAKYAKNLAIGLFDIYEKHEWLAESANPPSRVRVKRLAK